MGWQPIETAPKGREWVLAYGNGYGIEKCVFIAELVPDWLVVGESAWIEVYSDAVVHPTHWMPLPASPVDFAP